MSKCSKFESVAIKRVIKAIERIRIIGKLSNRDNYSYTPAHVKHIITTLKDEIDDLEKQFVDPCVTDNINFSFTESVSNDNDWSNWGRYR